MEKTKKIYFHNNQNYLKCLILHEHEYYIYKFQKLLRKEEKSKLFKFFYRTKKNILGSKLGFMIPANVFDEGLHIWHYGTIIVNGYSKVGKNCILHGNNCIGNNGKDECAPVIGNNVDIGFGSIIIGNVKIADNIKIAAGAVVINSFLTPGVSIGGIPAKELKKYD